MTMKQHAALSAGGALLIIYFFKNYFAAGGFFLGGVFVDLDHCLDYVWQTRDIRVSLQKVDHYYDRTKDSRFVVFMHSYELIALVLLVNVATFKSALVWGLLAGHFLHIIMDIACNPVSLKTYSFFYRLKHRFDPDQIYNRNKYHEDLKKKAQ